LQPNFVKVNNLGKITKLALAGERIRQMDLALRKKYRGLWEISPKIAIKDSYTLSLVYTPGVGKVSTEIAENPEKSFELTNRANSVAIIVDNSKTGALSKIPVVEMKAVLYNKFAGIDAYPLVLETSDATEISEIIINLAPTFAGFVLTGFSEDKQSQIKEILEKEKFSLSVLYESASFLSTPLPPFKGGDIVGEGATPPHLDAPNYQKIQINKDKFFNDKKTAMLLRSRLGEADCEQRLKEELCFSEMPFMASNQGTENLSLGEKSVELHKRARGVIKTACKVNLDNIFDETRKVSEEIIKNPDAAYELTPKGNLVAVISDGSAVLGLGNIGAEAAMPVMEGKSVLFKTLGGIDAMPICLKTQNTEELINIISKISPILGGINLEDISAPRCFEIEKALIEKLDIPVFHDDQHGTAVVVLAGFINALKLTGKNVEEVKIAVNGAGAGATAVSKLLLNYGVKNLILCDRTGAIFDGRVEGMNPFKREMAEITNPDKEKGQLKDVIKNADFFIGLSAANVVNREMVKSMAKKAVIFALANPVPEIMPEDALEAGAFIVATGRSDFKNQVNNSLAFPGIFRGAMDVRAEKITDEMKISAAHAIANLIEEHELNPEYIIPHALDSRVPPAVAKAVSETAIKTGMARKII